MSNHKFLLFCSCVICKEQKVAQSIAAHYQKHITDATIKSYCLLCKSPIYNKQNKFCCNSHAASFNNPLKQRKPKILKIRKNDQFILDWLSGNLEMSRTYCGVNNQISSTIRKYLLKKCDNKCEKCGWCEINKKTGKVPVQVNHIDGDSTNNRLENLEVLCPNCHSLTDNFGNLNKGRGRKKRYAGVV